MPEKKREKRKGQLVTLKSPVAMSLVEKPANRSGFKVIRNDDDTAETKPMKATEYKGRKPRKKKQKRDESLYLITLPEGISNEEAEQLRSAFAMEDDYDVWQDDVGRYYLRRKNVENWDKIMESSMTFDMGNGFLAHLDPDAFEGTASRTDKCHGVSLVELRFDGYDIKDTREWLNDHDVDFKENGAEVVEGGVIVTRREFDPVDGRKVRLGDGIIGVVVRAADNDVPAHLYRAVIEESYGSYGWGLLDFAQYLAAPYYADATWDGIYALREVLENVTLYSGLPLDERMRLVDNAVDQFKEYFKALIEAMPRETITASQRFDRKNQEAVMPKQTKDETKVEERKDEKAAEQSAETEAKTETRSDDKADDTATAAAAETGTQEQATEQRSDDSAQPAYVSREELNQAVAEAVTAALAAREDAGTEKKDEQAATEQRDDETQEVSEADKTLASGIEALAGATKALTERMDSFDKKLDTYGESVEARSERTDEGAQERSEQQRKDPFEGMFASLKGLRPE